MKQTYQEFLEESTNTVKAKQNLEKIILLSTYFIVWAVTMVVFWQTKGPMTSGLGLTFRRILLPLLLLASTVTVAKNDYWGKGNWFCIMGAAITFLTVPYTEFVEGTGTATFAFRFPNLMYMVVGIIVSICGIGVGTLWKKKISS